MINELLNSYKEKLAPIPDPKAFENMLKERVALRAAKNREYQRGITATNIPKLSGTY